ncbi:MAG TPA: tetratricopeptide repeat protein [Usitatibacter sp.]|jgi:tetratricopeptide (TPR) repeat protein|nr:tetratricopeptide repeat protein [Usitatibacter sp.]
MTRARLGRRIAALCLALAADVAFAQAADPLAHARSLLQASDAKAAFAELAPMQGRHAGEPEFDYLLGVAALDSGHIDDAIIAFERVLAVMPNHAGARMDLARAYYAAGAFDLAEAAFQRLQLLNPPPQAQAAIARYLSAIRQRRNQAQEGWLGYTELGIGYDSNLTGVPTNFGAAALQSFNIVGIEPTGNAVKRHAPYVQGLAGIDYSRPVSRGWNVFAAGDLLGRAYRSESDFNIGSVDVRAGAGLNQGQTQWRFAGDYLYFKQEGEAPGDPKPTNDRHMAGVSADWRRALDPKTQVGLGLQLNSVRFPTQDVEDFNQVYLSASWLHSFERQGVPLVYLTGFLTDDHAIHTLADGSTTKSKNLAGLRAFGQYSLDPKLQVFAGLGAIYRRDKDAFARSTTVEKGRDTFGEASAGLFWSFQKTCGLRLLYAYTRNNSNIDIYDFDRHEISTTIRCDIK